MNVLESLLPPASLSFTIAEILIIVFLGVPTLLLLLKLLRGEFWPGDLFRQYQKGKQEQWESNKEDNDVDE